MESKNNAVSNQQMAEANAHLQALKAEPATPPLPTQVQANLRRAFKAQHAVQGEQVVFGADTLGLKVNGWRNTFAARLAPIFAVIAVMAGAMAMVMSAQQNGAANHDWQDAKSATIAAPFIALKDIKLIALELNTTIVETQLSPMQLVRLGIPVNPSNTASAIPAQVLMSDSGEALALKLDY